MIKSFIPGRIRFRHDCLKQADLMDDFTARLKDLPGLENIAGNPVTGSLTVYYTPDSKDATLQAKWLQDVLPQVTAKFPAPKKRTAGKQLCTMRNYYRLMTLTFAVCLFSPAMGLMQAHRYSAFALTGLLARHVYDYRKRIF